MATKTDPHVAALKAIAKSLNHCAEGLHAIAHSLRPSDPAAAATTAAPQPEAAQGALEQFSQLLSSGLKSALGTPETKPGLEK